MSTLAVDNITDEVGTGSPSFANGLAQSDIAGALNATGSAPIYACRAWVNFDGTGTVSIRDSGNVSSITDNGAGSYTVNFATAMPDGNHASSGLARDGVNGDVCMTLRFNVAPSSSSLALNTLVDGNFADADYVTVAIFR